VDPGLESKSKKVSGKGEKIGIYDVFEELMFSQES
jgi:hypothetical protein